MPAYNSTRGAVVPARPASAHGAHAGGRSRSDRNSRQLSFFSAPDLYGQIHLVTPGPCTVQEPAHHPGDAMRGPIVLADGVEYEAVPLDRDAGDEAFALWRLVSESGPLGPIVADCRSHAECDCDEFHREWDCAHVAALADAGLLSFAPDYTAGGRRREVAR